MLSVINLRSRERIAEGLKVVCLTKPVPQTALSALNNLQGDQIEISNAVL